MKASCYLGVLAAAVGWASITLSAHLNPWFNVAENALSDLGALTVRHGYVFNIGIAVAGVLALAYTRCLASSLNNSIGRISALVFAVAAVQLIMIGIFPEGTWPHTWVSIGFFVLAGVAIMLSGVGLAMAGSARHGLPSIGYSLIGFAGSALIKWPSIALLELYCLALINLWIVTMLHHHFRHSGC